MRAFGKYPLWMSLLIVGLITFGCVQTKMAGSATVPGQSTALAGAPVEMVSRLGDAIEKARADQLDVLSPKQFERARDAYEDAKEALSTAGEISDIQAGVLESRDYLQKAEVIADTSRTHLADTLKAREAARDAGAVKLGKPYERVEKAFLDLTRAIEKGKLARAEEGSAEVTEQYRQVEILAIKEEVIGGVRRRMDEAKAAKAHKLAPQAYERAAQQLAATDAFISAHPHDREAMQTMAEKAMFETDRLMVLGALAGEVKEMRPEEIVTLMEERLHAIGTALDAEDLRDQAPQAQVNGLVAAVNDLKSDRHFLSESKNEIEATLEKERVDCQTRIDELNIELSMLAGKSREDQMARERMARERKAVEKRLAKEREFNQRYVKVRTFFEENEAEVYKQENQLVLRLKAMHFPVGQSALLPQSEDLLAKVRKAIGTFKDPRVIIEGHTDATGPVKANMLLSQKRAEAVRDYLIANQPMAPERISAVGYGSERPLASNATPAGRAINRRIDIRIIPQDNTL